MIIIGLTGGIACGKSTVSTYLRKLGLHIIDLDVIARDVVEVDATRSAILKTFPEAAGPIPTGAPAGFVPPIDRVKLGAIVFQDEVARKKLNQLMRWPIISTTFKAIWRAYWAGIKCSVIDAPLLFESGLSKLCSVTVTVYIEKEEDQIGRLLARDLKLVASDPSRKPLTLEEAQSRVNAQMPLSEKRKRSTYELDNSGSVAELENQIDTLIATIKSKHKAFLPRNSLITYLVTLFFLGIMFIIYLFNRPAK
jgi:dephospho-CoA kinase